MWVVLNGTTFLFVKDHADRPWKGASKGSTKIRPRKASYCVDHPQSENKKFKKAKAIPLGQGSEKGTPSKMRAKWKAYFRNLQMGISYVSGSIARPTGKSRTAPFVSSLGTYLPVLRNVVFIRGVLPKDKCYCFFQTERIRGLNAQPMVFVHIQGARKNGQALEGPYKMHKSDKDHAEKCAGQRRNGYPRSTNLMQSGTFVGN